MRELSSPRCAHVHITFLFLSSPSQPDSGFDAVGKDIIKRFAEDEPLKVTVLTLMGKELAVQCTRDHEA